MSRGRFGALVGLLVVVVGAAAFFGVLQLLEDPAPTPSVTPPSTATSSTAPVATAPGHLDTPTFVAIVSSGADEGTAQANAAELTERGYDSTVLRSDDYTSLEPGFWVAYVGPFADAAAAQATTADLIADGYGSTYVRCVGTADECA